MVSIHHHPAGFTTTRDTGHPFAIAHMSPISDIVDDAPITVLSVTSDDLDFADTLPQLDYVLSVLDWQAEADADDRRVGV